MPDRSLLEAYVAAWNAGDADGIMSFFADDFSYTDRVLHETYDASTLKPFLVATFDAIEGLAFKIVSCSCGDNAIAWEWRMTGRRGDGSLIDEPGMSMTVISNDKITRNTDYWSRLKAPPR